MTKPMRATVCLVAFVLAANPCRAGDQTSAVKPLAHAHAHNDYLHRRPLRDALDHGFMSVEADIFLVDGQLLVAHDEKDVRPERTLTGMYLDPLRERSRANGGWVFDKGRPFTLLIDIKSEAEATYAALHIVLADYSDLLTTVDDGKLETKAVTIIVSGNRAIESISAQERRYAAIDGRFSDLDSAHRAHLIPLISDNWQKHFQWTGDGPFPDAEREKLHAIVKQAHERGRRVRLWATPEGPAVWKELLSAGVDLINTDDLEGLDDYLRQH
jgi:glycerophosphoryl diester phosphodiesterase